MPPLALILAVAALVAIALAGRDMFTAATRATVGDYSRSTSRRVDT